MISASEKAYVHIRDMIVRGELRSGDPLIADDLAQSCGFSRTPVREAIFRLQAEMFAMRLDNKRTVVRAWSSDEIEDFVELRLRVAGYMAARIARKIDDAEMNSLDEMNDELAEIVANDGSEQRYHDNITRFHAALLKYVSSERLERISVQLANPGPLLQTFEKFSKEGMRDTLTDHRQLASAFRARDGVWAEAAMAVLVRRTYHSRLVEAQQEAQHPPKTNERNSSRSAAPANRSL